MRYSNLTIPGHPKVRIVVSAYFNHNDDRVLNSAFCCIYSLLAQTYNNIEIFIHHDGELEDTSLANKFRNISDKIVFLDNLPHKGSWGFYHRHPTAMIEPHADWVLFTNEDNYYTPDFLKIMLHAAINNNSEMAYCNMVHSHSNWSLLNTKPAICYIDMGCFITKMNLIANTPWTDYVPWADGIYATKIAEKTNPTKVENILFVHN